MMRFRRPAVLYGIGLCVFLLAACAPEGSEVDAVSSINEYYDVQGLLKGNEAQLRKMEVVLRKKATFAGEVEEATVSLDSAALAEELEVFREVDINRPVLSGRYLTEREIIDGQEVITYQADEPEELNVNFLKIYTDSETGEVERMEALFSSRNILYNSTRLLRMEYGKINGRQLPVYYEVKGSQKMIFSSKEDYIIKADFVYADSE